MINEYKTMDMASDEDCRFSDPGVEDSLLLGVCSIELATSRTGAARNNGVNTRAE